MHINAPPHPQSSRNSDSSSSSIKERPRQHSVKLSDDVWAATLQRAELEGISASDLCERVLKQYLDLIVRINLNRPTNQQLIPVLPDSLPNALITHKRSVYVTRSTWASIKARKVIEHRSISAILEHLLRTHLALDSNQPATQSFNDPLNAADNS